MLDQNSEIDFEHEYRLQEQTIHFHDLINRAVGIQGYRAFEIDHDLREALREAYQGASLPVSVDPEKSDMGERKVAFCLAPVAGNGSHFVAVVWDQMLPCRRPVIQFSTNSSSWATRRGQEIHVAAFSAWLAAHDLIERSQASFLPRLPVTLGCWDVLPPTAEGDQ